MFRFYLALWLAKLSIPVLRLTGHSGTDFPGSLALRICPDYIERIAKPATIYAVTGTNGKTTTSNMIKDALHELGVDVLNNSKGSNIASGIASVLTRGVTAFNREKYDTAVIEVDERSAKRIFPYCKPNILIVTNLTRDSIMRNAHPEYIRWFLESNLPNETTLILNSDDMVSCNMCEDDSLSVGENGHASRKIIRFGIDRMKSDDAESRNLINDAQICPKCHTKLKYDYYRYSNTGRAYCEKCGYTSPKSDYTAVDADLDSERMFVRHPGGMTGFNILSDSVFNLYNQMATITLLATIGYSIDDIRTAFSDIGITGSRYYHREIGDINIYRLFCKEKNAYASSRVFQYLAGVPGDKEIILYNNCIGDTHHWSESTCWFYDCDFEFLARPEIKHIIVYGDRGLDYRFRLRLAGVSEDVITVCNDPYEAIDKLKYFSGSNIYVLYGTDSLDLGLGVAEQVEKRAEEVFSERSRGLRPVYEDEASNRSRAGAMAEDGESDKSSLDGMTTGGDL